MRKVPEIGAQQNLESRKISKPYNDFTKTFDAVQARIPLRKQK